ncbi:hypothetical protein AAAC51_44460 [Priestia megaterium]
MGIAQLLLSLTNIYITVLAFGLFGLAYGMFNPLLYTYSQQKVPSDIHGRFFSFKTMIDRTIIQLCLVIIGFLLDQIGYKSLMMLLGLCTFTLVFLFLLILSVLGIKIKMSFIRVKIRTELGNQCSVLILVPIFTLREQENPLNKRSGGYFYRSIVKLTTDTLCNVENE